MAIERLNIGAKEENQGRNMHGKLSALEFNSLTDKVNEMIDHLNKRAYLSQDEYDALVLAGTIDPEVEYNVYEE